MPNGHDGIYLSQDASDNSIGGASSVGEENVIAYNMWAGVGLAASAGADNYVDPNFTYSNGGLGVDIYDDGQVLPNDYGNPPCIPGSIPPSCPDADGGTDGNTSPGPNRLMNYPVITGATYDGSTLMISGTLDTYPGHYYNMFFLWNEVCDPSGYGEGKYFLGNLGFNATIDSANFSRIFNVTLTGDVYLTMSASDPESSSEFSACFLLHTGVTTPSPTPTQSPGLTPTPTAAPEPKQGDINCDDRVTGADVMQFLDYLALGVRGTAGDGCPNVGAAIGDHVFLDTDCDGSITARDVLVLLIKISGANQIPLPTGCLPVGDRI
jgi:hypothetical protein